MKKLLLFSLLFFSILVMTACGTDNASTDEEKEEENTVAKTATTEETENIDFEETSEQGESVMEPVEPEEDTVCEICKMKVYGKEHEMGVFTAQGITQDGKTVFFDDVGCIMNYNDAREETLKTEWVRDYETLEWTEVDKAVPVKTDLKSPMKWGYVFFDSEERAENFIVENSDLNPGLAKWEDIDKKAAERYQKKMETMKNQDHSNHIDKHMKEDDN